jgi:hypothetical protein
VQIDQRRLAPGELGGEVASRRADPEAVAREARLSLAWRPAGRAACASAGRARPKLIDIEYGRSTRHSRECRNAAGCSIASTTALLDADALGGDAVR